MRISTKGRYALRLMLDLAQNADEGYISLKVVADRQGISKRYLDQIMMVLNRTEFLESARGSQGGYRLAGSPSDYTVGAILRLTEGSISPVPCLEDDSGCGRAEECMARNVWAGLDQVISDYLDGMTLQNVLDEYGSGLPINFSI